VGSFGHEGVYTFKNDIGPDDANHAPEGMFILYDPRKNLGGRRLEGLQVMDVAPTMLDVLGLSVPADVQGKVVERKK
jgi:predicted AlkP superfamily phosphohydrolase/phosphomutase